MRIFKFFFDDAKEENWINDMANQGWLLKKYDSHFITLSRASKVNTSTVLKYLITFLKGKM